VTAHALFVGVEAALASRQNASVDAGPDRPVHSSDGGCRLWRAWWTSSPVSWAASSSRSSGRFATATTIDSGMSTDPFDRWTPGIPEYRDVKAARSGSWEREGQIARSAVTRQGGSAGSSRRSRLDAASRSATLPRLPGPRGPVIAASPERVGDHSRHCAGQPAVGPACRARRGLGAPVLHPCGRERRCPRARAPIVDVTWPPAGAVKSGPRRQSMDLSAWTTRARSGTARREPVVLPYSLSRSFANARRTRNTRRSRSTSRQSPANASSGRTPVSP
jgi:hypothetical protein